FENETQEVILERMLQKVDPELDKREGSIVFDMTSPASIELAKAYIEMDNVLQFGFAQTSYGPYLEMRAREVGLYRKPAVKSIGELTFNGPAGTEIPAGTQVSNNDEEDLIIVETLENATITSET